MVRGLSCPLPRWVLGKLCRLAFYFCWKGKRDLVARSVVVQDSSVGGFSVVDVKLKVQSMLVVWVKRYVTLSPAGLPSCLFGSVLFLTLPLLMCSLALLPLVLEPCPLLSLFAFGLACCRWLLLAILFSLGDGLVRPSPACPGLQYDRQICLFVLVVSDFCSAPL